MLALQAPSAREGTTKKTGIQFEVHPADLEPGEVADAAHLPYRPAPQRSSRPALTIWEDERMVWVDAAAPGDPSRLAVVPARSPGSLGLQVVRRQFSAYLAVRSYRDDLWVNALPALRFSILASQDSILLAGPRLLFYVTERFFPYVGPPPEEVIGKERCPHCRNRFEAATKVVRSYCGTLYHCEDETSHPHLTKEDRLECMQQCKVCGSCHRELTTAEHLVWDPLTI